MYVDVVQFDVCGVVFGSPYRYTGIRFIKRENQYHLIKDVKSFITNAHYVKSKISMVSAEQAKKHISPSIVLIKEKLAMRWIGEGKYISWGMY